MYLGTLFRIVPLVLISLYPGPARGGVRAHEWLVWPPGVPAVADADGRLCQRLDGAPSPLSGGPAGEEGAAAEAEKPTPTPANGSMSPEAVSGEDVSRENEGPEEGSAAKGERHAQPSLEAGVAPVEGETERVEEESRAEDSRAERQTDPGRAGESGGMDAGEPGGGEGIGDAAGEQGTPAGGQGAEEGAEPEAAGGAPLGVDSITERGPGEEEAGGEPGEGEGGSVGGVQQSGGGEGSEGQDRAEGIEDAEAAVQQALPDGSEYDRGQGGNEVRNARDGSPAEGLGEAVVRDADAGDEAGTRFDPVPTDQLTTPPRLKKGFNQAPAPVGGPRGVLLEGRVVVEFDVGKDGQIHGVRVVESTEPELNERTLLDAERFEWYPAEVDGFAVDSRARLAIDWVRGAEVSRLAEAPFRKGELSMLGQVQLINAESSFGVGLGTANIDKIWYAEVRPNLNLHFERLSIGFGMRLRFQVFDTNVVEQGNPTTYSAGFAEAGRFRAEDWDRFVNYPYTDLVRPLRYVTWGRKEEHLFVDVSRVHAITIGHGQLVRRYAPNVDIDESNIFAELDAYQDFGGMEVMLGPLPIPRLLGGLFFIKPLGPFRDDYRSKSLSIGLTYVTDLNVPTVLVTSQDPVTGRVQYPIDKGRFIYDMRDQVVGYGVQGVGIDAEFKPIKTKQYNIKTYVDYSHLFFPDVPDAGIDAFGGGGATLGGLFRFSWGSRPVRPLERETEAVRLGLAPRETKAAYAARLRAELKAFDPQYVPSYFDSLYEVDKYQFGFGTTPLEERATLPTKMAFLAGQGGDPRRVGCYLEATYALVDWFALSLVYQDAWPLSSSDSSVPEAREIIFHAETQGLKFLQLFASYHYRNFELEDWERLFTFTSDNEIFYLGGRFRLWMFALNLGLQRGFRMDFLPDDGPPRPYEEGGEAYPHSSVGLENQWNYDLEFEIGWQF